MKKNILFLILSLCFTGLSSYAQDSNDELLKKLVEKEILTQKEADEIAKESSSKENTTSLGEKVDKIRDAFNTPYMNFGGYGLLQYKYSDVADNKHNFEPRVIFLSLGGKLPHNIGYYALYEFVNPRLHEFYLEWTPDKKFNFRIGEMKVPFTLENQLSLTVLETIPYTRSISALSGMGDDVLALQNGINNTGRDIGMQISGSLINLNDHDFLEYTMGVFQGAGINTSDKNNTKDFSGTIMLQPIKGFRAGGGVYFGEATYSLGEEQPIGDHVRNRWTIGADYKSDRLYCRAEWIRGKDSHIQKEGLHGMVQYYLQPEKFNIAGKVDYFNKDRSIGSEVIDYTVALNYFFYPRCRVQLNYTYSDYSKIWGDKDSNNVLAQLQISF